MEINQNKNELHLYPINNNEYMGAIDVKGATTVTKSIQTVVMLDSSGSMKEQTARFVKEILPMVMSTLNWNRGIDLIQFSKKANWKYLTLKELMSIDIKSGGSTRMGEAIRMFRKCLESIQHTYPGQPIRVLIISDGAISDPKETQEETKKLIDFLATTEMAINSQAIRLFTSSDQPDTRALACLLQINNTAATDLCDINVDLSNEEISKAIAALFQSDWFVNYQTLELEKSIILKFPWYTDGKMRVLVSAGWNIFWFKEVPSVVKLGSDTVKVVLQRQLSLSKFEQFIETKLAYIIDHVAILKVVGTAEANRDADKIFEYFKMTEDALAINSFTRNMKIISNLLVGIANKTMNNNDSAEMAEFLRSTKRETEIQLRKKKEVAEERIQLEELERLKREEDIRLGEEARIRKEEEKKLKAAEEEAARIKKIEAEKAAEEDAARIKKIEAEKAAVEEAARIKKIEAEKAAEAIRIRKLEEDERLQREEDKRVAEEARKKEEEEKLKASEEDAARIKKIEAEKAAEEEAARIKKIEAEKAAEAIRIRKLEEDERLQREEDKRVAEEARKKEEEEKLKASEEDAARIKKIEAEKEAEEEAARIKKIEAEKAAEAIRIKKLEEDERLQREEDKKVAEEARRKEEEEKLKASEEQAARIKKIEAEKAAEEEVIRIKKLRESTVAEEKTIRIKQDEEVSIRIKREEEERLRLHRVKLELDEQKKLEGGLLFAQEPTKTFKLQKKLDEDQSTELQHINEKQDFVTKLDFADQVATGSFEYVTATGNPPESRKKKSSLITTAANKVRQFTGGLRSGRNNNSNPTPIKTVFILHENKFVPKKHCRLAEKIIPLVFSKISNENSQLVHVLTVAASQEPVVQMLQSILQTLDANAPIRIIVLTDMTSQEQKQFDTFADTLIKFLSGSNFSFEFRVIRIALECQKKLLGGDVSRKYQLIDIDSKKSNVYIAAKIVELFHSNNFQKHEQEQLPTITKNSETKDQPTDFVSLDVDGKQSENIRTRNCESCKAKNRKDQRSHLVIYILIFVIPIVLLLLDIAVSFAPKSCTTANEIKKKP